MALSFEDMLAHTSLFSRLGRQQLGEFAARAQLQAYDAGQEITRQGELGTGLYVIVKGSVDILHDRGKPAEVRVATLSAGDFFGELALLLSQPRGATVVAREPTEVFALQRWDFRDLALTYPEVLWGMAETLAERLARADEDLDRRG